VYEDIKKDPVLFMRRIYEFLGVDPTFVSSMVYEEINVARTPKQVWVDRVMHHTAEFLRKTGFDRLVHLVRQSGLPDVVRSMNTKAPQKTKHSQSYDRDLVRAHFVDDVTVLSTLIGRDMRREWNI
jgi:hypothetical protein